MFTGLVEGVGQITELTPQGSGFLIRIKTSFNLEGTKVGDSIAVDGVCLTVVQLEPQAFRAQLSPETISRTTFKLKKVGDLVNLERALKLGDRLGGHLVTGHVDGVGAIKRIAKMGDYTLIEISIPKDLIQYMVPKGSIAVDGISLTINEVLEDAIRLMIIPHTLAVTTLGVKKVGDLVNLEVDVIAKMVHRFLKPYLSKVEEEKNLLTFDFLKEHGFA